jgi:hypothetical protein
MSSKTPEIIADNFNAVAAGQDVEIGNALGAQYDVGSLLNDTINIATGLNTALSSVNKASQNMADPNTSNVVNYTAEAEDRLYTAPTTNAENRTSSATASSGQGNSILSFATSLVGGGLGIVPLVSGILGLFGGGPSQPPPLEKYVMPDPLHFTEADTGGGMVNADRDQFGAPRLYSTPGTGGPQSNPAVSSPTSTPSNQTQPQINVTVHAMDSQSFLDHSTEIAQAVRQAMLNSNSLNDIVSDL